MHKIYTCMWLLAGLLLLQPQARATGQDALEELAKDANIIIRSEETVFTVNSINSGTTTYKVSITILNEHGNHRAKLYVGYDKLRKVEQIEGASYDRFGKKIKSLKSKDIVDVSAISDFSLFEDNRVKIANLTHTVYPYTVEFSYQLSNKNMLFYPGFYPQDEERLSVEKASYEVRVPLGTKLRYQESNMPQPVKKGATAMHETYIWQVQHLKPVETEPYGPGLEELVPLVRTAPSGLKWKATKGQHGKLEKLWPVGKPTEPGSRCAAGGDEAKAGCTNCGC